MSKNYPAYQRLESRTGKVLEIEENPRGYYALVEFDEDPINEE